MSRARRVTQNFAILSVARLITQVMAVLVTLYLTKVLQPQNYGVMIFAMGVLGWANIVADFGLTSLGQREAARENISLHLMVRVVIGIQLIFSLCAFACILCFAIFSHTSLLTKEVIFLYGLALPISPWDLRWVFFGREKIFTVSVAETIGQAILTVGALLFVKRPEHLIALPIIYIVAQILPMLYVLMKYRRQHGFPTPTFEPSMLRHLLKDALPLCGSSAIGMVLLNFAALIVPLFLSMHDMGLYGAAQRIVWVPTLFIAAYYLTLRPSLARAQVEGLDTISGLLRKSVRLTVALAMGMMTGGVLLGAPFIELAFGKDFMGSVAPFEILVLATGLIFVNRLFRGILISFNHQFAEFKMMLAAAITNIVFAIALIGRFGLAGVAFATLLGELVMLLMGYFYTRFLIGRVAFGRFLNKPFVGCVAMAAVLYFTPNLHVVVRIAAGCAVYTIALLMLGVIHRDDVLMIARALLPASRTRTEQT